MFLRNYAPCSGLDCVWFFHDRLASRRFIGFSVCINSSVPWLPDGSAMAGPSDKAVAISRAD
jgi:hypothetical protein